MKQLPKAYEAKQYEDEIYKRWEASGFFAPEAHQPWTGSVGEPDNREPFSILMPPPNVTGVLHLGHALENSLMDTMARYQRMLGKKVLLLPGTDHAAVATQAKVEKVLVGQGIKHPREELGREKLLAEIRKYAEQSKSTILKQIKKMGTSCDWSRLAYTFDNARSSAVNEIFVRMYNDGLIYRGYRVVNWSVKGQSTCSDDELVSIERPAKLYYFKYSKDFPITIATTRPETKLGDTAVAVNPKDERYAKYLGQVFTAEVGAAKPLQIKIIGDEHVESDFGTGALGVTPAHAAVDFDMYNKQKAKGDPIGFIQVIGIDGRMTKEAGEGYAGLSVEEAREKFVQWIKDNNLLEKEEDITQNVGTSDRFGDVVEALPMTQWFVDVNKKIASKDNKTLKESMHEAVATGLHGDKKQKVAINPERFEKLYFSWIENLRDWCISRQIWWGHRMPVWYCESLKSKVKSQKCSEPIVNINSLDKCPYCGGEVTQDPDTLDTWFSSGLWTFSTLGWPNVKTIFVRHGEAECNAQSILDDEENSDWDGLTEKGRQKIKKTAKEIKKMGAVQIIASPVRRTRETAEIISQELGIPVRFDKRLWEVGMGDLKGKKYEEFVPARNTFYNGGANPYKIEAHTDLEKRTTEFLQDLNKEFAGKTVIVVSHGDTIGCMAQLLPFCKKRVCGDFLKTGDHIVRNIGNNGEINDDLQTFHPTTWMQMGHEILFFWMARMILVSSYTLDQIPFKNVYIHGILRDEQGKKFSKSLGNGIDPIEMTDMYGCDALRVSLLSGITPGNDSRFYTEKIEGARNFVNKFWNISRYVLSTVGEVNTNIVQPKAKTLADKWILNKFNNLIGEADKLLESCDFSLAIEKLREFTWNDFADWYLEIAKIEGEKKEILQYILVNLLKLWHPFMPFVTEVIWTQIQNSDSETKNLLMVQKWPEAGKKTKDAVSFDTVKNIITGIRSLRADYKIEPAKKLNAIISAHENIKICEENESIIKGLARLEELKIEKNAVKPDGFVGFVESGSDVYINLAGTIDTAKEKARLEKEKSDLEKYATSVEKKLANEQFVKNAPPAVVEVERKKLADAEEKVKKISAQLASLK